MSDELSRPAIRTVALTKRYGRTRYGVDNIVTHEPDLEDGFLDWYDAKESGSC